MVWKSDEDWSHKELTKCWFLLPDYTRGKVLDIGSGHHRLFDHWITSDSGKDFGGARVADVMTRADHDLPFSPGWFDAVVSSHCLEHIEEWESALRSWWDLVRIGGHLVLYLPHKDLYPNIGQPGANPDHKHDFVNDDIIDAMDRIADATGHGWTCVEDEVRDRGSEYSFFQVYRKEATSATRYAPWRKPEKSALVVRLGALGDQLVAASILPHLKDEGWTVTYQSAHPGAEVIAHDPHIDRLIILDKDQVRNEDLGPYWDGLRERYDRIINLCESIEGELLTLPGRPKDALPDEVRRKLCDVNYLERTHDIAGVPHDFRVKFYPTHAETAQCQRAIIDAHPGPVALWILAGSAPHKMWPYMAQAVVRLMYREPDLTIVMAGDERCRVLEDIIEDAVVQYFGTAKRLVRTCGLWPTRGTMALAQMVNVVIGPETGVLNAVCMDDVPKVCILSHSSENMLTKHWRNTTAIQPAPELAPKCFPCARLHQGWERCHEVKELGAAACQAAITPEQVVDAIVGALWLSNPGIRLLDAAE